MKILYKSSAEQQTEILIRQNMAELERQKKRITPSRRVRQI